MSARLLPTLLLGGALLSSCTLLPARRPYGPTPTAPAPTPTPGPLLTAAGRATSYLSPAFSAPFTGWQARWTFDCRQAAALDGRTGWRVSMVARHAHRRQQPAVQTIVLVPSSPGGRRPPARGQGTTAMTTRGTVYIAVAVTRGCSWTIRAIPLP